MNWDSFFFLYRIDKAILLWHCEQNSNTDIQCLVCRVQYFLFVCHSVLRKIYSSSHKLGSFKGIVHDISPIYYPLLCERRVL